MPAKYVILYAFKYKSSPNDWMVSYATREAESRDEFLVSVGHDLDMGGLEFRVLFVGIVPSD